MSPIFGRRKKQGADVAQSNAAAVSSSAGPDPQPDTSEFTQPGGSPAPGLKLRRVLPAHAGQINRLAWSPKGRYLAAPSDEAAIRIWRVEDWERPTVLQEHADTVLAVAWSPDESQLASGGKDAGIRIWQTQTWGSVNVLSGHSGTITSLAWSPHGVIASGSSDNTVRLWKAETGAQIRGFTAHSDVVCSVAWSPDGETLASGGGGGDRTIRLWSAQGDLLNTFSGHNGAVSMVAWSPDGRTLASAGSIDNTVRLWDVSTGRSRVIEGHTSNVQAVAFSFDGRLLASKCHDNTVRIWRADTGAEVARIVEFSQHIWTSLAFHLNRPWLATLCDNDSGIRIWKLEVDILLGIRTPEPYTTAKIVLVGDSGVGKTGLGWRLAHGEFKEHASTHGQQFWVVDDLHLRRRDGTECEAVLWDLAGQHIYRSVHTIFLDNVDLAVVLFDPTNRQDPLKGAEFWLEHLKGKGQLPPAVLVGARADRGASVLSQQELNQFCQRYSIRGGYIRTSALTGEGLGELIGKLKALVLWDELTAIVTNLTFKRIKDYVLALKQQTERPGALVRADELRRLLEATDSEWRFTTDEMMTAVGHLETHGYVVVLRGSTGGDYILLRPELLADLAASIFLLADRHPRELGALSETTLLQGGYPLPELSILSETERPTLLDAAVARFLEHNLCFREALGPDMLLIFPSLIKQKRPLNDLADAIDNISYIVRGRVENVYAALAVLLGYTPTFTRVNQWQSQAQYELGTGQICGFRMIDEREGEIELVLYYTPTMPEYGRDLFRGLFEQFLYQRNVSVQRIPPIACPNGHRQERATVIKRLREGKNFLFCEECGERIDLPEIEKPSLFGAHTVSAVQRDQAQARLRSLYETYLVSIKGFRRDRAAPRAYISYVAAQADWAAQLARDLREAGVLTLEDRVEVEQNDALILICTPDYKAAWERADDPLAADAALTRSRSAQSEEQWPTVIPLVRQGGLRDACPLELRERMIGDFRDEARYVVNLFDLVLALHAIPGDHPTFEPLRANLRKQLEEMQG